MPSDVASLAGRMHAALVTQVAADVEWLQSATRTLACADGIERRVVMVGSGPFLVCVPVLGSLNFLYAPQIRLLQERSCVLTYEPVVSTSAPLSLAARVAELDAVIRTVGAKRVDVLGWSDGGAIACGFAARVPAAIRSLVLFSLPRRFRGSLRAAADLMAFLPIEQLPLSASVVRSVLGRLSGGPVINRHLVVRYLREIPDLVGLFKYSVMPLLKAHSVAPNTIAAAALVVVGANDRLVSVKEAAALVAALPAAKDLVVIPDGEHFLTYANAEGVNVHLRSFLAESR